MSMSIATKSLVKSFDLLSQIQPFKNVFIAAFSPSTPVVAIEQFFTLFDRSMKQCSNENIRETRIWLIENHVLDSEKKMNALFVYLVAYSKLSVLKRRRRLSVLYLLNDILYVLMQKKFRTFPKLESKYFDMYFQSNLGALLSLCYQCDSNRSRLWSLVELWLALNMIPKQLVASLGTHEKFVKAMESMKYLEVQPKQEKKNKKAEEANSEYDEANCLATFNSIVSKNLQLKETLESLSILMPERFPEISQTKDANRDSAFKLPEFYTVPTYLGSKELKFYDQPASTMLPHIYAQKSNPNNHNRDISIDPAEVGPLNLMIHGTKSIFAGENPPVELSYSNSTKKEIEIPPVIRNAVEQYYRGVNYFLGKNPDGSNPGPDDVTINDFLEAEDERAKNPVFQELHEMYTYEGWTQKFYDKMELRRREVVDESIKALKARKRSASHRKSKDPGNNKSKSDSLPKTTKSSPKKNRPTASGSKDALLTDLFGSDID